MSPAEHPEDGPGRADAAAFEEIVAGWRAEGAVPSWPDERRPLPRPEARPEPGPEGRPEFRPEVVWLDGPPGVAEERCAPGSRPHRDPDDDHFVPPEPPPLPPIGRSAAIGVGLVGAGLLLVIAPEVLGLAESTGITVGLLALAGGIGWLVLRTWSADPEPGGGDGEDDGAVL